MPRPGKLLALAQTIDAERAPACAARFAQTLPKGSAPHAIATLLGTAYPAIGAALEAAPDLARRLDEEGFRATRLHGDFLTRILSRVGDLRDAERALRELRRAARDERIRIALRELLPPSLGGADVDVTARELAALADATIEVALAEAVFAVSARFGEPRATSGAPARFTVLGMGKLSGEELNPGSDVDLVYFYDTDDGAAEAQEPLSLHDFWTRVARRLTSNLEEVTADGFVWRVDLRLRPEGRSGPLVNSLAAAERYYESFGRLWERAALLRARPVAGDRAFGEEVLAMLSPFIWRRRVDPKIAVEMAGLAQRARAQLSGNAGRDLKLGPGGIREAEFFVQTLQLIWGGKEPRVRARGTLDGLRRLRAAGFVTDREAREIAEGYLALRRAEHAVQFASGVQTHARPDAPDAEARLARALGFADAAAFGADVERHMKRIAALFVSLLPEGAPRASRFTAAIAALERADEAAFADAVIRAASTPGDAAEGGERWRDVAGHLFELSRHADAPLGGRTREQFEELAEAVLEAVVDAADPEQAARYLRIFFARVKRPGVYIKLLGDDTRAVRRLVEALGASAFIGDALANNPELGDVILFARGAPTADVARAEVGIALGEVAVERDGDEAVVEALRRAKARVTLEVGLADLASQITTREATHALSALADAELEAAARHALHVASGEGVRGLAILAMGKLGGREIGYGSDLDVLFLFDPAAAPPGVDADPYYARSARKIIQLISVSHAAGPGYELDTRLRPSGNQGLLVTSIDGFARYHGIPRAGEAREASPVRHVRAAAWERLALLRARAAAGDLALGAEAIRIAHAAAYEVPAHAAHEGDSAPRPPRMAEEIHRLRMRLERENSQERRGRYDLKLGRGGLVDVEFAVQLLQLAHGRDPRVRTTETAVAIEALAAAGYLAAEHAETLRDGYAFLRKLEQRIRILHGTPAQLIEESAPGLFPLARRVGIRDRRGSEAAAELLARYREVTERVRATYEAIVTG